MVGIMHSFLKTCLLGAAAAVGRSFLLNAEPIRGGLHNTKSTIEKGHGGATENIPPPHRDDLPRIRGLATNTTDSNSTTNILSTTTLDTPATNHSTNSSTVTAPQGVQINPINAPVGSSHGKRGLVSFFAIGDVPYSDMEKCLLPYELERLTSEYRAEGDFLIHLGDIKSGDDTDCEEWVYEEVADIFSSSPIPTFFILGDNEWNGCRHERDAYEYWERHLLDFNHRHISSSGGHEFRVRRHPIHREMFSFVHEGVLFLGQNLPGSAHSISHWDEWLKANADWLERNFFEHGDEITGAVIFGHSNHPEHKPYFERLKEVAHNHQYLPILYLMDAHQFEIRTEHLRQINLIQARMDDSVTPTRITFDPEADTAWDAFQFDRGCSCTTNHRDTIVLEHRPGSKCHEWCSYTRKCRHEDPYRFR